MDRNVKDNYCKMTDYGPEPFVANVDRLAMMNRNFRSTLWTGEFLQMTLMQIDPCQDIGLEIHPDHDQFLMVVNGCGLVMMGKTQEQLNYQKSVQNGCGIFVPAGTWHNLVNTGNMPLKLFSLYAPPAHPHGTVHPTKADAEKEEAKY